MAKNDVEVRIRGDAKGFNDAVDGAHGKLSRLGDGLSTVAGGIAKAGAVAAVGIGAGLAFSVGQASDLNESLNAVQVTFGDAANGIMKLGENAATSVGLSNTEFNGLAVQFSSFAKNIAGPGGDVVDTMSTMTGRVADFASVMNLDVPDAAAAFQSGLAGETEPLKKFGIDLSDAAITSYALANGIIGVGDTMTEAQKVQARYGSLMEQTAVTQGDFANTSDGLANQQRILKAELQNVAAKVGTALLPVLAKLAVFVGDKLLPWFEENWPKIQATISDFVDWFVQDAWPVIRAVGEFIISAMQNIVAWFQQNWPQIRATIAEFVAWFQEEVLPIIQAVVGFLVATFQDMVAWVQENWPQIKETIDSTINAIRVIIETVIAIIGRAWSLWGDELIGVIQLTWGYIKGSIEVAINLIRGVIQTVTALISGDWSGAWDGIKATVQAVWDGIQLLIDTALGAIELLLSGAWDGIKLAASTIWDGLKNAAQAAWDGIVNGVIALPGRIAEQFTSLFNAGSDLAGELVDGVVDGLSSLVESGLGVAEAFANSIIGFLNSNVIDKINNLLEFTVSIPTSPWSQQDFHVDPPDIGHIPTFHAGGIVPGMMGAEVPIMAQAGEMVLTREQQEALGGGRGISIGQLVTSRPGETVEELRRLQWLEDAA